jgi:hypothetical protein
MIHRFVGSWASITGRFAFSLGVGLILTASAAFGQGTTGSISGTVRDPVGQIIVGASVQATSVATGKAYKSGTSKEGAYTLSDLPAGAYDVSLSIAGMAPFSAKGVMVAAGNTARIDIDLKEGSQLSTLE